MRDKFFILILVGSIELIGAGCFVESFGGSVCLGWGSFGCCGGVSLSMPVWWLGWGVSAIDTGRRDL